jgi:hypothetical protein
MGERHRKRHDLLCVPNERLTQFGGCIATTHSARDHRSEFLFRTIRTIVRADRGLESPRMTPANQASTLSRSLIFESNHVRPSITNFHSMLKICLAFGIACTIAHSSLADEVIYGELNGKRIAAVVPLSALERQPEWDGNENDDPPKSVAEALKLSKLALDAAHPSLKDDTSRSRSLVLRTCSRQYEKLEPTEESVAQEATEEVMIPNCWLYVIIYRYAPPMNGPKLLTAIPVVVLMDGSTFVGNSQALEKPSSVP